MAFTLHPLTRADIPACVTIYFAAFQNPHSLGCWPRTPAVRAWWEAMMADELDEPGAHWLKAVSAATGELAGFVKWQQPTHGVAPSEALPRWPEGADARLCQETFGAWARGHRELMGERGHWCRRFAFVGSGDCLDGEADVETDLEIVAMAPAFQGKGAGSQMIRWATEQADREGVEAFLEASPDAVALYERHGFHEGGRTDTFIDNERIKETWYRNLFMIRPPQQQMGAN